MSRYVVYLNVAVEVEAESPDEAKGSAVILVRNSIAPYNSNASVWLENRSVLTLREDDTPKGPCSCGNQAKGQGDQPCA